MAQGDAVRILLAAPRGFCAGVERAIRAVEDALATFGAPVYVRHEIVHNAQVVGALRAKGAVFVDHLSEADPERPVVFSAHGVPKAVPCSADARGFTYIDATCPLVSKVHAEAKRFHARGLAVALVGHAGHPEVIGTLGQLPEGAATLIETEEDARRFQPADPDKIAYVTQTTLSVDDTASILAVLRERFPALVGPAKGDICYATSNRQDAVKAIAGEADVMLIVGDPASSNSNRLVETARAAGCPKAVLVDEPAAPPTEFIAGARTIGVSSGASTPETSIEALLAALRTHCGDVVVEERRQTEETVAFRPPAVVTPRALAG
ncbi:MAG: 4-hydroxy-3-methylbut-2-enyl diphosphate reductase [Pseudomonadota bacterium]